MTSLCSWAFSAASSISSRVKLPPKPMFSAMVVEKRKLSWGT